MVEDRRTGSPVGFNGFLPLKLRVRDERFVAVQGVDGFVDPNHRGRGLFAITIEFMAHQLSGAGPELLIGFNLPAAAAAAVRAGPVEIGVVHQWTLKKKWKKRIRGAAQAEVVQSCVPELNRVYEDWAKTSAYVHTSREPDYLDWRVTRDPMSSHECYLIKFRGESCGYIVTSKTEEEGEVKLTIDDYIVLDDDYGLLVEAISELHATHRPGMIEIRTLPNAAFERGLADSGLSKKPEQLYTLILRGLSKSVAGGSGLMRGDIDLSKLASWYLTYLDVL